MDRWEDLKNEISSMFLLKLLARMYSLFNVKAKATWSVAVYPCVLEGGENHHNDDQT